MTLRVLDIVGGTSVDGPGLRTSVYFAGCNHHCPGCHNPQSWDAAGGMEMTIDEIIAVIDENDFNVTLSGGDPLMQVEGVTELARRLKEAGRNVWCYTGYTYEQVSTSPQLSGVLPYIDVLVDGAFIESRRDVGLRFRGSSNQRLIDVARSEPGSPVVWGD
ncbi:MAG: anaerobic ribonucleoside-triphosphate reductase activating protein [Muribaculum sp.]|nr:anaerobic ribonucleoside-triphosphate reductase activating protein [Muribaculum sp.]